jgi:hypothetical protein
MKPSCLVSLALLAVFGLGSTPLTPQSPRDAGRLPVVESVRYRVFGQIRLLVAWAFRREVGEARLSWLQDDAGRGFELLIGTDPKRAPFGMNKWGYMLEESRPEGSTLLGLMTEADAESVAQARKDLEKTGDAQIFKRIDGTLRDGEARFRVSVSAVSPARTYRDLDALLNGVRFHQTSQRRMSLKPGTRPGLVSALSELLVADAQARAAGNRGRRPNGRPRVPYVYNGTQYELLLDDSSWAPNARFHGESYGDLVETDFEIENLLSHDTTDFTIYYNPADTTARVVPVRAVYRPKWWLQLELLRDPRS